eukprot:CFRG2517T1
MDYESLLHLGMKQSTNHSRAAEAISQKMKEREKNKRETMAKEMEAANEVRKRIELKKLVAMKEKQRLVIEKAEKNPPKSKPSRVTTSKRSNTNISSSAPKDTTRQGNSRVNQRPVKGQQDSIPKKATNKPLSFEELMLQAKNGPPKRVDTSSLSGGKGSEKDRPDTLGRCEGDGIGSDNSAHRNSSNSFKRPLRKEPTIKRDTKITKRPGDRDRDTDRARDRANNRDKDTMSSSDKNNLNDRRDKTLVRDREKNMRTNDKRSTKSYVNDGDCNKNNNRNGYDKTSTQKNPLKPSGTNSGSHERGSSRRDASDSYCSNKKESTHLDSLQAQIARAKKELETLRAAASAAKSGNFENTGRLTGSKDKRSSSPSRKQNSRIDKDKEKGQKSDRAKGRLEGKRRIQEMLKKSNEEERKWRDHDNQHTRGAEKRIEKRRRESLSSWVDDNYDDEVAEAMAELRQLTGYEAARFYDLDRGDDRAMETGFHDIDREERRSARIGRQEDLEEERRQLELEEKRMKKKRTSSG